MKCNAALDCDVFLATSAPPLALGIMKNFAFIWFLLVVSLVRPLWSQTVDETRARLLMGGEELLQTALGELRGKSPQELEGVVRNLYAPAHHRAAAARQLLREGETQANRMVALLALDIRLPRAVSDDESGWTKDYPVAAEAALHQELMPEILRRAVDGEIPLEITGLVMLNYEKAGALPGPWLQGRLKTEKLNPEQRLRIESLLGVLVGKWNLPKRPALNPAAGGGGPAEVSHLTLPETHAGKPRKDTGGRPEPAAKPKEPWVLPVAGGVVLAAIGLLWLLLKRRK